MFFLIYYINFCSIDNAFVPVSQELCFDLIVPLNRHDTQGILLSQDCFYIVHIKDRLHRTGKYELVASKLLSKTHMSILSPD